MSKLPLTSEEAKVMKQIWAGYGGLVRFLTPTAIRATCSRLVRKGYLVFLPYEGNTEYDNWRVPPSAVMDQMYHEDPVKAKKAEEAAKKAAERAALKQEQLEAKKAADLLNKPKKVAKKKVTKKKVAKKRVAKKKVVRKKAPTHRSAARSRATWDF